MRSFTLLTMRQVNYSCFAKSKPRFLLLFVSLILFLNNVQAQSTVVAKGIITQQNGDPIIGVSVVVKSTGKGTTTLADGSFQIEAPANSTLVFTHTGFVGQELKLTGANQPLIAIRLIETKNSLDEVVVVGYGTRKKSDVTGAISSVTEQAIKEIPAANLTQALQGQAAGIDIQKNGGNSKPGATPT